MDLAFLPATEQARLVRSGEVSSLELVRLYLERIERIDPQLNSFVTVCGEEALAAAEKRDAHPSDGPFHGVPIAIKDLTATAGIRTTYSCRAFADNVPDFDTSVVRRVRKAGFVIVGKTNTPEFGTVAFTESELNGSTSNPWNRELTPGGSSGGAAAAVAAGLVPIAHGSDGGGSIRIPASCCGLFGLKPSRGRVSSAPFSAFEGLSTGGSLARYVTDCAAFLDVISGYETGDAWWAPPPESPFSEEVGADPGRLRIGVAATPPLDVPVHADCVEAVRSAAALLEDLGHHVEDATPAWSEAPLIDLFIRIWQVTAALYPVDLDKLTPLNRGLAEAARKTSSVEYALASLELQAAARQIVAFWETYDILLTPTLALPPVAIGWQEVGVTGAVEQLRKNTYFTPFTAVANLTGLPAMSLPLHQNTDGLPIGVQAIGPPAGDALLIRLAAQLERARPWSADRPPIS
jgi:amidase